VNRRDRGLPVAESTDHKLPATLRGTNDPPIAAGSRDDTSVMLETIADGTSPVWLSDE
jgi:hypothetical protein